LTDQKVSVTWICSLFLAQTIKWPAAIRYFFNQLFKVGEPNARGASARVACPRFQDEVVEASVFVDAYRKTLLWAHAREWGNTFKIMNWGLQDAQTGLAVNGVALGLLQASGAGEPDLPPKRRRHKNSGQTQLNLGPAQTSYTFVAEDSSDHATAIKIVENMMAECEKFLCCWPATNSEVTAFELMNWAKAVRRHKIGNIGFSGGADDKYQYKVQSFVRAALLIVHDGKPDAFSNMPFGIVQEWLPDQNKHCIVFEKMRVKDVEANIGVSGLLVSMWTCLARAAGETGGEMLMKATDRDLLNAVDSAMDEHGKLGEDHGDEHNGFLPMLKNLVDLIAPTSL